MAASSRSSVIEGERREEGPALIDEAALARLDELAKGSGVAPELLAATPARDISAAVEAMLVLLDGLDYGQLLAKQGGISRLLGADIEARLKFELAGQEVLIAMQQLRQAAANGRRTVTLLRAARSELAGDQARLDAAIAWAQRLHAEGAGQADPFLLARFERRLASMIAMSSSNVVTAEQMVLAENVLASLLDRVTDVDTVLLPLWQRNMLALAHAAHGRPARAAADAFASVQTRLITHLKQGQTP